MSGTDWHMIDQLLLMFGWIDLTWLTTLSSVQIYTMYSSRILSCLILLFPCSCAALDTRLLAYVAVLSVYTLVANSLIGAMPSYLDI